MTDKDIKDEVINKYGVEYKNPLNKLAIDRIANEMVKKVRGTIQERQNKKEEKQKQSIEDYIKDLSGVSVDRAQMLVEFARGDIDEIQKAINKLEKKVKKGEKFDKNEKVFLRNVYWCLAVGATLLGPYNFLKKPLKEDEFKPDFEKLGSGYPEASKCLFHYLSGKGTSLELNSEIYETSTNVQAAVKDMKVLIAKDAKTGNIKDKYSSKDLENKPYLQAKKIIAEQTNLRLKNVNNTFDLQTKRNKVSNTKIETLWEVNDEYEFMSYAWQRENNKTLVSHFPIKEGKTLTIDDGLSQYLVALDMAKKFSYSAKWEEAWNYTEFI